MSTLKILKVPTVYKMLSLELCRSKSQEYVVSKDSYFKKEAKGITHITEF